MSFTNKLLLNTYSYMKKNLNPKLFKSISASKFLEPIRDNLLRKNDLPKIMGDQLQFENLSFYFEAPIKVLHHAKTRGLEARISRVAMAQLKPGSVAIDVGANYGFITLVMAKSVQPKGKIISFEPITHINRILKNNITQNGLDKTCLLIDKFAGQRGMQGIVTVDDVVTANNIESIDFMKIDVDGGDFEVLLGAEKLLSQYHPALVIEMGSNQPEILKFLKDIGYMFFMGMNGEEVIPPMFPPNMFASMNPISIPARGSLQQQTS